MFVANYIKKYGYGCNDSITQGVCVCVIFKFQRRPHARVQRVSLGVCQHAHKADRKTHERKEERRGESKLHEIGATSLAIRPMLQSSSANYEHGLFREEQTRPFLNHMPFPE